MRISEQSWLEYIRRLARLNERAGQELAGYLARHGAADADAITAYAYALVQKYAEGSAELACQMYDAVAGAAGLQLPPAEPAAPAGYGEVAKLVRGVNGSGPLLQGGVQRLVKRAGADTTLQNALRDGAEFAWIPHGDTCPFCIALASRGWQRISKKALKNGHAEHIHAHCDCEYAVRFDGKSSVAGYDPERYRAMYDAAGGDINAMRRAQYAKSRERINAQKRAAYAARRERQADQHGNRIVETIGRSVGAKSKNYSVYNPQTGSFTHLAEGTHITQPKNHVMAGAGRSRQIDHIDWLVDKYGGDPLKWTKEKGFGFVEDEYGEIRKVELHWYQEPTVGKVEMKIKLWNGGCYLDDE